MSDDSTKNHAGSLFKAEMADVAPLKPDNKIQLKKKAKQAPLPPVEETHDFSTKDSFSDAEITQDCPDILSFSRSGLQHKVLKKLRQGNNPIERCLDLHGLTVIEARTALIQFLYECETSGAKHTLIIHGKGFRSKNRAIIKPMVNRWLREADNVLAFHSAQPRDGGSGAVYVLLKKLKPDDD